MNDAFTVGNLPDVAIKADHMIGVQRFNLDRVADRCEPFGADTLKDSRNRHAIAVRISTLAPNGQIAKTADVQLRPAHLDVFRNCNTMPIMSALKFSEADVPALKEILIRPFQPVQCIALDRQGRINKTVTIRTTNRAGFALIKIG